MSVIKKSLKLKIDNLEVEIKPLSFDEKCEVQALILEGSIQGTLKAARLAVQYAIKDIKGLSNEDGSDYELQFENNKITDNCFDDLSNLEQHGKISGICMTLLNGIPSQFVDPETGKKMDGVSYIKTKENKGKK